MSRTYTPNEWVARTIDGQGTRADEKKDGERLCGKNERKGVEITTSVYTSRFVGLTRPKIDTGSSTC